MRLIIAGSRNYPRDEAERHVLDAMLTWRLEHGYPTFVLTGGAKGIDAAGYRWAVEHLGSGWVATYPADWGTHGKKAGPIRNRQMAENADALLLIWDGKSPGSASMLKEAQRAELHITQVVVP